MDTTLEPQTAPTRRTGSHSVAVLVLGLLAGCGGSAAGDVAGDPGAPRSSTTLAAPSATSASPAAAPPSPAVPRDVPQEVLLPAAGLEPADGPRTVAEGTVAWRLPEACRAGAPEAAVAMRTLQQGDGAFEAPVAVQQVAVHADAASASAEVARVQGALVDCVRRATTPTGAGETSTRYLLSRSDVGADGVRLVVDYYGVTADDPAADGLGYAVVLTRRGTAVTLVAAEGGESSISASRTEVARTAQQAWQLLCRYQVDGCG